MGKKGGFFLGAVIGGTAAAVTALLFAPKAGKELRQDLADQADEFKDKAMDYTDYIVQKSSELSSTAKEKAESLGDQTNDLTTTIKNKVQNASGSAVDSFKQQTDNLTDHFQAAVGKSEKKADDIIINLEDTTKKVPQEREESNSTSDS